MKLMKIMWLLMILTLIWGCQKKQEAEQEVLKAGQELVSVAEVSAFNYACLPFMGGYENHEKVISDFMTAVMAQHVNFTGPLFGIYYNNPMNTLAESLRWEIGFQVTEGTQVAAPLVLKTWSFTKVAQALYIGPYDSTATLYPQIFEFIGNQKMTPAGPTMERFIDQNPQAVPPESLKTEIWVPLSLAQAK